MRPMLFMPPQPSLLAEAESGEALQLPKQHVHESVEAALSLSLSLPPSSASLEVTEEEVLVCTLCYQPSSAAVRLLLKLATLRGRRADIRVLCRRIRSCPCTG